MCYPSPPFTGWVLYSPLSPEEFPVSGTLALGSTVVSGAPAPPDLGQDESLHRWFTLLGKTQGREGLAVLLLRLSSYSPRHEVASSVAAVL